MTGQAATSTNVAALMAGGGAPPAIAANNIGVFGQNSSNTVLLLPVSGVTAGRFTVVNIQTLSSTASVTVTDNGSGSSWTTLGPFVATGTGAMWLAFCPSIGTGVTQITMTANASSNWFYSAASQFTNMAASPRDAGADSTGQIGVGTTGSDATGGLAQAHELILVTVGGHSGFATFTAGNAPWATLTGDNPNGLTWGWVENTVGLSGVPTDAALGWTAAQVYGIKMYGFKGV